MGNNGGKEKKTKKVGEEEEEKTKKAGELEEEKSRKKKNKAKEKTKTEVAAESVEEPVTVKKAEITAVPKETLKGKKKRKKEEKKVDEPTAVVEETDGKEDPKVISEGEASENVS